MRCDNSFKETNALPILKRYLGQGLPFHYANVHKCNGNTSKPYAPAYSRAKSSENVSNDGHRENGTCMSAHIPVAQPFL